MFHTFAAETLWNGNPNNEKLDNNLEREIYKYRTFVELVKEAAFGKSSPDLVWSFKERCTSGIRVPEDHATIYLAKEWLKMFGGRNVTLYMDDDDGHIIEVPKDHATLVLATEWFKKFTGRNVTLYKDDNDHIRVATETVTIPNTILLGKGAHEVYGIEYEHISSVVNIVGDPGVERKDIVIMGGGIWFKEGIPGNCHLQHLTLRQAKKSGVRGESSFTMDDVLVEQCNLSGVLARGTDVVGRCTNVEVRQCGWSGVTASSGASITLIGAKTTVHHNCTTGHNDEYGLKVKGSSSSTIIQLVAPLTKEEVSKDNGGGGNWRAETESDINQSMYSGLIKMITQAEFQTFISEEAAKASRMDALSESIKSTFTVNVPEDGGLFEAVRAVQLVNLDKNFTADRKITIVVGQGEHQIDGDYLSIFSATNIEGNPGVAKEDIVIMGGILFKEGIQGNCHLQHVTLRQAKKCGVYGESSFTMEDVVVEQCGDEGVVAMYTGVVGRCTDVEVRDGAAGGVVASDGASIILIGPKTKVHGNCTDYGNDEYGLTVYGTDATIQLVYPLTKETVSTSNGNGNWGVRRGFLAVATPNINQIRTID